MPRPFIDIYELLAIFRRLTYLLLRGCPPSSTNLGDLAGATIFALATEMFPFGRTRTVPSSRAKVVVYSKVALASESKFQI